MPLHKDELENLLKDKFKDGDIVIQDLAGDGDHYAVTIASKAFEGLSKIKQHQLVYSALGEKMGAELHAMALKTQIK